jgi:hypothetical protein
MATAGTRFTRAFLVAFKRVEAGEYVNYFKPKKVP